MDIGKIEFGPITKLKEDWSAVHGAAMAIDETVSVLTSNLCVCEHPFSRHTVAPSNAVDDSMNNTKSNPPRDGTPSETRRLPG